jgi:uncharacterized protein
MKEAIARRLLALTAMLLMFAAAAQAKPPLSDQPPAAQGGGAVSYVGLPQESYQVFVFGDSLAAGMFAGMSRMAEGDLRISIDGRFKDDSGLARPEFHDWAAALPKIHERREIDIAVILLGSNDGQDIRTISGPIQFGTPEWASAYAQRVDDLLKALKDRGIAVYWVELPPMGPAPLEAEAAVVATVQRDRAVRASIRYVETRKIFSDPSGRYTDRGMDLAGKVTRLRSRDGIHFLKTGNNKLGMMVLEAIRGDIAAADGRVALSASPQAEVPPSATPEPQKAPKPLPVFGQMPGSPEESALTVIPADPQWASAVLAVGTPGQKENVATEGAVTALRERVNPQSSAGVLLIEGQWPEPRKGRHDDFSWPAAAE